jgi:hypothetical protein
MKPGYFSEGWYAQVQAVCAFRSRASVAAMLGISAPSLSQVLNGSGKYGSGEASTGRIADRVVHTFGRYACPHLTDEAGGESVVITAEQCRSFAHREPPTGSPRDMQHWQSCRSCPHKAACAPPIAREVHPRKPATTQVPEDQRDSV